MLADRTVAPDDVQAALDTLSHWLLGPVRDGVGGLRRLIVVPHGVLTYLPFSALRTADGRYLIERYVLVHQPSVSFGASGSPEIGPGVKVVALAPLPRQLPASALEARAVARVRRGALVLTGRSAGEPALRQALRSGDAVHVASHGVLNGMNPLFSRIELAPGRSGTPADDGRLEVHEVLDLGIESPLVFLSGCETGLGPGGSRRYAPGEDYTTLAASFLTAGAGQVVATLWMIPDTGAAVFAERFYRELVGSGVAESLAAAQRALLADPRYRHPYYWAGYRLARRASNRERAAVS
jgi:CHAT domain-containing protein